ncbi:MAG: hypothetical protein RIT81_01435 [Deltaproteobacteria bacterium]
MAACAESGLTLDEPDPPTPCRVELPTQLEFGETLVGVEVIERVEVRLRAGPAACLDARTLVDFTGYFTFQGAGDELVVRYAPDTIGAHEATLSIGDASVNLTGSARPPRISMVPSFVDFGVVDIGCAPAAERVELVNEEVVEVVLDGVEVDTPFTIAPDTLVIAPGASTMVDVGFTAVDTSTFATSVVVRAAGVELDVDATLSGSGRPGSPRVDTFSQVPPLDIDFLFVVSTASSMGPAQAMVEEPLNWLLRSIEACGSDARYAVTDADPDGLGGAFAAPGIVHGDDPGAHATLTAALQLGTNGSRVEPLATAVRAMTDHADFPRPGAAQFIAILADSDDASPRAVAEYVAQLEALTDPTVQNTTGLIVAAGPSPDGCTEGPLSATPAPRLEAAARETSRWFTELCDAAWWEAPIVLDAPSPFCAAHQTRFTLSEFAVPSSVAVFVNGESVPAMSAGGTFNWSFDVATNAVHFSPFGAPEYDAEIRVEYRGYVCD